MWESSAVQSFLLFSFFIFTFLVPRIEPRALEPWAESSFPTVES